LKTTKLWNVKEICAEGERRGLDAKGIQALRDKYWGWGSQAVEEHFQKMPKIKRITHRVIFRPWREGPDGRRIHASDYGYRAWPILVRIEEDPDDPYA
jgi:hypothetical protein